MTDLFSLFAVVAIGIGAAQVAKISQQLSSLPGDWTSVVREHADFRARVSVLESELEALRDERDRALEELDKLTDELRLTTDALARERDGGAVLRSEADRLTALLKESERRLAELADAEARIHRLRGELQEAAARNLELEAERKLLAERIKALEAEAAHAQLDEILALLAESHAELEKLRSSFAALREENDGLRSKISSVGRGEAGLRRQLLGLEGELGRVVFVLDRSGSMDVKDNRIGRNRWNDAIATIDAWLRYLAVDEAALVVFSGGVDVFPPDGRWVAVPVEGPEPLLEGLKDLSPGGATNTLDAIRRAYRYPGVEVVILFTDGAPDSGKDGGVGTADDILRFVDSQKAAGSKVCIHTVGIGDYFSPRMRDFLLQLSGSTGGTFIGR
jgi:predicted  nucleic acid-binding Zn-ribbon protein